MTRDIYKVRVENPLIWEGKRILRVKGVKAPRGDILPIRSTPYVVNCPNIKRIGIEGDISSLVRDMSRRGYVFIGHKRAASRWVAVFLKGSSLEDCVATSLGPRFASIGPKGEAKDYITLANLLCRRGAAPRERDVKINIPRRRLKDELWDGLLMSLPRKEWRKLLRSFGLSPRTKVIQVTLFNRGFTEEERKKLAEYIDNIRDPRQVRRLEALQALYMTPEEPFFTKGLIRMASKDCPPAVYTASWKFGLPGDWILSENIRVITTDHLYRPGIKVGKEWLGATMSIQEWLYNFGPAEREKILNKAWLPFIWSKALHKARFAQMEGGARFLGLGIKAISEESIHAIVRNILTDACIRLRLPGIRCKCLPNPELGISDCGGRSYNEVNVPRASGFKIGDKIWIHRDPNLPTGTSTQWGIVVGFTSGNFVEVGPLSDYVTLMGGDFDGDDIVIMPPLLAHKEFKRLEVDVRTTCLPANTGNLIRICRQAMDASIGMVDVACRGYFEEDIITDDLRIRFATAVQATVHSVKKIVHPEDMEYPPAKPRSISDRIIRDRNWAEFELIEKNSIYKPLANMAKLAYTQFFENLLVLDCPRMRREAAKSLPQEMKNQLVRFVANWGSRFSDMVRRGQPYEDWRSTARLVREELDELVCEYALNSSKKLEDLSKAKLVAYRFFVSLANPNLSGRMFSVRELREIVNGFTLAPSTPSSIQESRVEGSMD